ncbi:MAG: NTP transferase domain-containing protein, partial [Candidatus Coatesbacteria bacterium]|nr:NTP transferase domain-containing protein [Candidatus Coatesbacteria bacterium]
MKALILAAGRGANLSPLSDTRPKPMIMLSGKPLLEHSLSMLRETGTTDVVIVIGHHSEQIRNHFGRGASWGMNIEYVQQKEQDSIGEAILLARDRFKGLDYFILSYGDTVFSENIFSNCLASFSEFKKSTAAVALAPETEFYGNVYLDDSSRISRVIEKPKGSAMGNYVLAGTFVLASEFFDLVEKNDANVASAFNALSEEQGLYATIWEEDWTDVNHPWDILQANRILMNVWKRATISNLADVAPDVTFTGPVFVDDYARISNGVVLRGPCYVGKHCYIGDNCLIREFTSLGERTTVGYGVELKNCVLFGRTRIGRLSFVGDSVIGFDVIFGSGTMTVNESLEDEMIEVKIGDRVVNTG